MAVTSTLDIGVDLGTRTFSNTSIIIGYIISTTNWFIHIRTFTWQNTLPSLNSAIINTVCVTSWWISYAAGRTNVFSWKTASDTILSNSVFETQYNKNQTFIKRHYCLRFLLLSFEFNLENYNLIMDLNLLWIYLFKVVFKGVDVVLHVVVLKRMVSWVYGDVSVVLFWIEI